MEKVQIAINAERGVSDRVMLVPVGQFKGRDGRVFYNDNPNAVLNAFRNDKRYIPKWAEWADVTKRTETIFCKSFQAENLSRADIAYDARLHTIGIGLKTFIAKNGTSREKISAFNTHSRELQEYNIDNLVLRLASLRNERIDFANRTYGIKEGIYHCLARQDCKVIIFETGYYPVDVNSIKNIKKTHASLFFEDAYCEYSFNFSKSTLYKKFYTPRNSITLDIEIINDPYELILTLFSEYSFPQA